MKNDKCIGRKIVAMSMVLFPFFFISAYSQNAMSSEDLISTEKISEITCSLPSECGKITVPLDYSNPEGKKIEVSYFKLPSPFPEAEKKGVMFVNFGGPGYQDLDTLSYWSKNIDKYKENFFSKYDLVVVSPRGTKYSTGEGELNNCFKPKSTGYEFFTHYAASLMDNSINGSGNFSYIDAGCRDVMSKYIYNFSSKELAEDVESVRKKIYPNEKINIYAVSYGARLAASYHKKYPKNVNKIIYDSPTAILNLQDYFPTRWFEHVKSYNVHLNNNGVDLYKLSSIWDSVFRNAFYKPKKGPDIYPDLALAVDVSFISGEGYTDKKLVNALDKLSNDDDSTELFNLFFDAPFKPNQRLLNNNIELVEYIRGNKSVLLATVNCVDSASQYTWNDVKNTWRPYYDDILPYPVASRFFYNGGYACSNWQYGFKNVNFSSDELSGLSPDNVLIVGGAYDAATPEVWAKGVWRVYGQRAHYVKDTIHRGHGRLFSTSLSPCLKKKLDNFVSENVVGSKYQECNPEEFEKDSLEQNKDYWKKLDGTHYSAKDLAVIKADLGGPAIGFVKSELKAIKSQKMSNAYMFAIYTGVHTKLVVVRLKDDKDSDGTLYKVDTWYAVGDRLEELKDLNEISGNSGFSKGWERNYEITNIKFKVNETL